MTLSSFKLEFFAISLSSKVELKQGGMCVASKGVEHKPVAEQECHIMLVEPAVIVNRGEAGGKLTAADNVWI